MTSEEKKILLVEDEKTIRDAVAAYLEREGYIVRGNYQIGRASCRERV